MKGYLLDTNICVFLLRGNRSVSDRIDHAGLTNCKISDVTVAELWYGVECSSNKPLNAASLKTFLRDIAIVPFEKGIRVFAEEKARLRKLGTPIEEFDLLIASAAIAEDLVLVTDNIKHFQRIEGLKLENWMER